MEKAVQVADQEDQEGGLQADQDFFLWPCCSAVHMDNKIDVCFPGSSFPTVVLPSSSGLGTERHGRLGNLEDPTRRSPSELSLVASDRNAQGKIDPTQGRAPVSDGGRGIPLNMVSRGYCNHGYVVIEILDFFFLSTKPRVMRREKSSVLNLSLIRQKKFLSFSSMLRFFRICNQFLCN